MSIRLPSASVAAACLALAGVAHADPVTLVPGSIDAHVITFSPYDGVTSAGFVADDTRFVDVGTAETGIAVNLGFNNGSDHILGAVPSSFGSNGSWPVSGAYAGLYQLSGSMTFMFGSGMNLAGGYVNFDPAFDGNASLQALDINGDVLEEILFNSNTFTPGFFGFLRDGADIHQLVFNNARIAVDNLTFGVTGGGTGLPEPGTTGLVLASLGLLALTRRRA
jgi:hypothetical protein